MVKVVVTGGLGFIGRDLCPALLSDGHSCVALTRQHERGVQQPYAIMVDYQNLDQLTEAIVGADVLVHLADAADRNVAGDRKRPNATDTLIHAIERAGLSRVIYASSIYARLYAETGVSAYGAHKYATEQALFSLQNVRTLALRFPPVYGPGGGGGFAVLASAVAKGLPVPVGTAHAPRDYVARTNVTDLLKCLVSVEDHIWTQMAGTTFEPSDGTPVSTAELTHMMGQAMDRSARVVRVPATLLRFLGKVVGKSEIISGIFDPLQVQNDPEFRALIGWTQQTSMPDSLKFLKDT